MLQDLCYALETNIKYNFYKSNGNIPADENHRVNVIILKKYLMHYSYNRAICMELLKLKQNLTLERTLSYLDS
jgi:hypothetical protein